MKDHDLEHDLEELVRASLVHSCGVQAIPSTAHVVLLKRFINWAAVHQTAERAKARKAKK